MKFSILVPVYNVEKYINECIDSILEQTYKDFEVILIDDGSTDLSSSICDSIEDKRVKVFHQENKGLLMTRREAIKYASGEYSVFIDSDDFIKNNTLEILSDKISETNADVVLFNTYLFFGNTESAQERKAPFDRELLFESKESKKEIYTKLLCSNELNNLVIKAIRTGILKADPTDYNSICGNSMGEDLIQSFYPLSKASRILYIQDYLYYYRQNTDSMTHNVNLGSLNKEYSKINTNVLKFRIKYYEEWNINDSTVLNKIETRFFRTILYQFNKVFIRCQNDELISEWIELPWVELIPKELMNKFWNKKIQLSLIEFVQLREIFKKNRSALKCFKLLHIVKNTLSMKGKNDEEKT